MERENNNSINIGFLSLLGVAFIVLKLVGIITWSWVLVLSPIWAPLAVVGVIAIVILILEAEKRRLERKVGKE